MTAFVDQQVHLGIRFGDQVTGRENSDDAFGIGLGSPFNNPDYTGLTTIHGLSGDDIITLYGVTTQWESVFYDGGDGYDTISIQLHLMGAAGTNIDISNNASIGSITWQNVEAVRLLFGDTADQFRGGDTDDQITGGNGENVFRGLGGNDGLSGGNDHDELFGGAGNDSLSGQGGDDLLSGGDGINTLNGGDGIDTADYGELTYEPINNHAVVKINLVDGSSYFYTERRDSLFGIENVNGSAYIDEITGDGQDNTLDGKAHNDRLFGGAGDDTLNGGTGEDTIFGQNDDDTINGGDENDNLSGGDGIDTINGDGGNDRFEGGPKLDTMDGGDGRDLVDYGSSTVRVFADLSTGIANFGGVTGNEIIRNMEDLYGGSLDDILTGNSETNLIRGGGGSDRLFAIANSGALNNTGDQLFGEEGNDILTGSSQMDELDGGDDDDRLIGGDDDDTLVGGKGNDTLDGGAGADRLDGGEGNDRLITGSYDQPRMSNPSPAMLGGEGNDTLDLSGVAQKVRVELSADNALEVLRIGDWSSTATVGFVSSIESVVGSAFDDYLVDSSADNTLDGGAGNDWIVSQDGGHDTLRGGSDNDRIFVEGTVDDVIDGGSGTDSLEFLGNVTFFNFTASALLIERIVAGNAPTVLGTAGNNIFNLSALTELTGVALIDLGAGSDSFVGSQFAETVRAGVGVDTVNTGGGADIIRIAGGEAQDDAMNGGAGTDTIQVLGSGAVILAGFLRTNLIEQWRGNNSGIYGTTGNNMLDFSLLTSVTGLSWIDGLAGNDMVTGTGFNDRLIGNTGVDALNGGGGNDTLEGGADKDTLDGGAGDDTYVLAADTTDVVVDASGIDTIRSTVARNLGAYATIDNLLLEGSGHLNGIGNALINKLTGNSGNNILNGMAGLDTLIGGHGNDTYIIDRAVDGGITDVIQEAGTVSSAADVVQFTGNAHGQGYALGANLENLILLGAFNTNGAGNGLANTITGNSGANVLDGKAGLDTLTGGHGNDVYVVNLVVEGTTRADTIQETGTVSSAADLVQFTGSANGQGFVLGANLENLTLIGALSTNGTGNGLANTLTGNAANNWLKGGAANDLLIGGAGSDLLFGEGDNDTFRFLAVGDSVGGAARDAIQDFDLSGNDVIDLSLMAGVGSFIGGAAFSAAGQVRVVAVAGGVLVQINTIGIGGAESEIFIAGATTTAGPRQVDASDFLL